eukprot:TRINITY_DN18915_c0_g3_i1.p1 TRINITY_DN18915_c0_g3~~TRINITY_DN18915_c0_g3_i1.p1  ORF type:complete len:715 (+),score=138.03 TRINITY_DN18915_c0_g3_i1:103-2247(+)
MRPPSGRVAAGARPPPPAAVAAGGEAAVAAARPPRLTGGSNAYSVATSSIRTSSRSRRPVPASDHDSSPAARRANCSAAGRPRASSACAVTRSRTPEAPQEARDTESSAAATGAAKEGRLRPYPGVEAARAAPKFTARSVPRLSTPARSADSDSHSAASAPSARRLRPSDDRKKSAANCSSVPPARTRAVQPAMQNQQGVARRESAGTAAWLRGAQRLRKKPAPDAPSTEVFFGMVELLVRTAVHLDLRDACAVRSLSTAAEEACCSDLVWEPLYLKRWGEDKRPRAAALVSWKQVFFSQLKRLQAAFLTKTLPALAQKARRKDGLPALQKIAGELRLSYTLSVKSPSLERRLQLTEDSVQVFASAVCLRCTFSSLKLRLPLRLEAVAHSAATGRDHRLLLAALPDASSWGEGIASDENFTYLRSPCGHILLSLWKSDGMVAGLFVNLHHIDVLRPFFKEAPEVAWQRLAGQPHFDDLDSQLGLREYTVLLTLRSAKMEVFSNCFYKVDALKSSDFASVRIREVDLINQAQQRQTGDQPARLGASAGAYEAKVAHIDVLPPHKSGSAPPFPCTRPPQIVFQTLAFKSTLSDVIFLDATVFDEHGRVCWATSAAAQLQSKAPPHEELLSALRYAALDFDREDAAEEGATRWLSVADRGAAHLIVQLEYTSAAAAKAAGEDSKSLPRLNAITWHPELTFLDRWWGSSYSKGAVPER